MTRRYSLLTGLSLVGATTALSLPVLSAPPAKAQLPHPAIIPTQAQQADLLRAVGRLPLSFESNQGQTNAQVRFLAHTADSTLFLTPSEAVFTLAAQPKNSTGNAAHGKDRKAARNAQKIARVALRMQMVGANAKAGSLAQQPLAGKVNYLLGQDHSRWHTGVPTFGKVGFAGVYRGIDLVYYGNQQHLEYDFVVAPHADPKQIKLHFDGAEGVHLDRSGALVVRTGGRELTWQKPVVYQQDASGRQAVSARFRLKRLPDGKTGVSFALGRYDRTRPLVIDPVLLYSTYLGGTVSSNGDNATGIAIDSTGNAYIAGTAFSTDFPTTAGAFQTSSRAGLSFSNAFVTKMNAAGTGLVYSTYLGGSTGFGDSANAIAVDSSGDAYVTGIASSTNFPVTNAAYQKTKKAGASFNAFVTKLNPAGSALVFSTYLGGNTGDSGNAIAIDSSGAAYVGGYTSSTNFPTTTGVPQTSLGATGAINGFVTKLNASGSSLAYSTYLGGSIEDRVFGIAVDSAGDAFVTGYAISTDFPTTTGAYQTTNKAATNFSNAFVTKLNPAADRLVYSTYLGGTKSDNATGIAVDSSGDAYVVGAAQSIDFPVTTGALKTAKGASGTGAPSAFVTKVNPTGAGLVYSTYLGGSTEEGANAVAVDSSGRAYVAGYTKSSDFPVTADAVQAVNGAPSVGNAFVAELNAAGSGLSYATYLGGSASDSAKGIALDSKGNAYVTGTATSTDFPIVSGAFQSVNNATGGSNNSFVSKLTVPRLFKAYPDLNHDGHTDILFQNGTTNAISAWFMNNTQFLGGGSFSMTPPTGFQLVGVGDFSGNGGNTLLLQNSSTNQLVLWFTGGTNSSTITGGAFVNQTPAAGFKVVGVADFDGDGQSDIVFQNPNNGRIAIWFMGGSIQTSGVLLPVTSATGWNIVGTGDVNGDGYPDLIFQNQSTGQIAYWLLNGTTYVDGKVLTTVPAAGFKVVGVGDFNGDGTVDLLFQNTSTNQAAVWYLQGGAYAGGALLPNVVAGWNIVGPR